MLDIRINTLLIILVSCGISFSQPSRFDYHEFSHSEKTLKYRLLVPDANDSRKYPLVVFLHGSGERGDDNEAQLKWGVSNFATDENMSLFPAFVLAPQCPKNDSWANFDGRDRNIHMKAEPTESMSLLLKLIDQVIKEAPIDPKRVYITGLSMGGYGTFDALARRPDLFAAAVPVCGGGDLKVVTSYAHVPLWIVSGAEDAVVPAQRSIDIVNELMKQGRKPGYTQYAEVGHFSWLMAYSEQLILQWLFRQQKD
jgi:predicted peptidase